MKKKHRKFRIFFRIQFILLLIVIAGMAYYALGGHAKEIRELKAEAEHLVHSSTASDFQQNQISVVYAADGSVISTIKGEKQSYYLQISDMPKSLVDAITSIEDKRFFKHKGVDYKALLRAFKVMLENGGKATQGGSTITMQLARTMFLNQDKTWQRKLEEIFIARELEKKYTKDQILEFYLNNIYFGHGYYGILSASRGFFSCEVSELSLSQAAFLCAIPNNPTYYDPVEHEENTLKRRNRILDQMKADGKITETVCRAAEEETISLQPERGYQKNDYVETYAYYCATRAFMEQEGFNFQYQFSSEKEKQAYDTRYGEAYAACQKKLYTEGYQIYTSFDLNLQEKLQSAVDDTLADFTEVNEEGIYQLQSAAVCIDNQSGAVRAIVGGRAQEYPGYTLNRAYQSYRQPGSAIKPLLVYTPALERGYTPESRVVDEPVEDGPRNANGAYLGEITLRTAIERSVNTIAWKLYEEITPQIGLSYLEKMNFARLDKEDYRLATALGGFTNGVSPLEMASGYAAIENDGKYRTPTCLIKITAADGTTVYQPSQEEKEIYKQNAARMMTDALQGVLTTGTGKGLDLGEIPAAGKTGTTNNQKDGWFVGYTSYYTTSVWVGYDMPRKLKNLAGSTYPGKIWQTFMKQAHEGLEVRNFLPYASVSEDYQNGRNFDAETQREGTFGQEQNSELWEIEKDSESVGAPEQPAASQKTEAQGQQEENQSAPQEAPVQEIPPENNGQEQTVPDAGGEPSGQPSDDKAQQSEEKMPETEENTNKNSTINEDGEEIENIPSMDLE